MTTDQCPLKGAMLIQPGDLFGLLNILELAETGYIRQDALFATSPEGIIIELNTTPTSTNRRRVRSRSGSRGSRDVSTSPCSPLTSKKERRSSTASAASSRSSSSLSSSKSAASSSGFSESSSCSSRSSVSATSNTTTTTTTTTTTKPSKPLSSKTSVQKRPNPNPNSSSVRPHSEVSQPPPTTTTSTPHSSTFTYYSPTTHLPTTVDKSRPEEVPASVASEAITALIDKLDDIMAAKAGMKELPSLVMGKGLSRTRGVGVC